MVEFIFYFLKFYLLIWALIFLKLIEGSISVPCLGCLGLTFFGDVQDDSNLWDMLVESNDVS